MFNLKTKLEEHYAQYNGSDYIEKLSSDKIVLFFKGYFYKLVLNEAVKMTFAENANFDALGNIISLLTNEKLENEIMGKPMINAFEKAIRSIPTTDALEACLHGSKIMLLEKEFLGKTIFPTLGKNKKEEQKNYCGDCDCSCICDGGCNGDTNKCTSEKALKKECNHHCDCYITHMVENLSK